MLCRNYKVVSVRDITFVQSKRTLYLEIELVNPT